MSANTSQDVGAKPVYQNKDDDLEAILKLAEGYLIPEDWYIDHKKFFSALDKMFKIERRK